MVALVEDHVRSADNKPTSDSNSAKQVNDEDDNLNDRDFDLPLVETEDLKDPLEVNVVEIEKDDDLENEVKGTLEFQDIEDIQGSKDEQESIEIIENTEEVEKK